MKRLHILLPAFSEGYVFHNEAFVAPCLHRLDVELGVFGGDVQHRRAAPKRQPAIAVGKKLLRHIVVQSRGRNGMRAHAMAVVAPLLASVAIPVSCWIRPTMDEMLSTAFRDAQCQVRSSQTGNGKMIMHVAAHCRCGLT